MFFQAFLMQHGLVRVSRRKFNYYSVHHVIPLQHKKLVIVQRLDRKTSSRIESITKRLFMMSWWSWDIVTWWWTFIVLCLSNLFTTISQTLSKLSKLNESAMFPSSIYHDTYRIKWKTNNCTEPVQCCCLDNNLLFISMTCWVAAAIEDPLANLLCSMWTMSIEKAECGEEIWSPGGVTDTGRDTYQYTGGAWEVAGGSNTKIIVKCPCRELEIRDGFSRNDGLTPTDLVHFKKIISESLILLFNFTKLENIHPWRHASGIRCG